MSGSVAMLRGGLARVLRTIYQREPWWAEFWSGAIAIAWAVICEASADPLSVSEPSIGRGLERIASSNLWALLCISTGIAQLSFLFIDLRKARWACAIVMAWFPCMTVISMLLSGHMTPHIAVYSGWAGINIFSIFRLLRHVP